MNGIQVFDSHEEMMAALQRDQAHADATMEPWQSATKVGDHYITMENDGLVIYGEILPTPTDEGYRLPPNYRFVCGYSAFIPEGEMGEVHCISFDGLLTKDAFERARTLGWPSDPHGLRDVIGDDPRYRRVIGFSFEP